MPFVDDQYSRSIFSAVMVTERPDAATAALNEGKILVFIDGSPGCMILPTVFADNFRTMDDYCEKPYFAAFSRWIKYLSFLLAVILPGLYAALVMFHPEVFPLKLLLNLAAAEEATPYPLVVEMVLLIMLFEIMREAGLRLPKSVGSAVSIVGGLIIGDAAVKSGLISTPLLTVTALAVMSGLCVPELNPPVTMLRFAFLAAGGALGLFGISLLACGVLVNICATEDYGFPYTAPLSPFAGSGMGDTAVRSSFRKMQDREFTVEEYHE